MTHPSHHDTEARIYPRTRRRGKQCIPMHLHPFQVYLSRTLICQTSTASGRGIFIHPRGLTNCFLGMRCNAKRICCCLQCNTEASATALNVRIRFSARRPRHATATLPSNPMQFDSIRARSESLRSASGRKITDGLLRSRESGPAVSPHRIAGQPGAQLCQRRCDGSHALHACMRDRREAGYETRTCVNAHDAVADGISRASLLQQCRR